MKTFQQFCEDAYQLNEGATTAAAINPIQRGLSAIGRPLARAFVPAYTAYDVYRNFDKAGKRSLGPIERSVAAAAAVPGPHRPAASLVSYGMETIPGARKFDKQVIPQHSKAYKANPQAYTQMLGRSF